MSNEHDAKAQLANEILANIDKIDDILTATGRFPHYAHVSLGGGRRIARGAMNIEQINRRRLVIKQGEASSVEHRWLDIAANALNGTPPETKISDVLLGDMERD